MKFNYSVRSEKGPRPTNEDSASVFEREGEIGFIVADGVGGHGGGAVASRLAVDTFHAAFSKFGGRIDLLEVALEVHALIVRRQGEDVALRQMATTFTAGVIGATHMSFAHSGDSRLVLQRHSGIRRLTSDHTEAQRLLNAGKLTPDEYDAYPRKNVLTSALGIRGGPPTVDVGGYAIETGDRILALTDGVYSKVPLRALKSVSDACSAPQQLTDAVVAEVIRLGADDNLSIVAVFCD